MTERERDLLKALCEANAPSGFEDETVRVAREAIGDVCDVEEDHLRNLYLYRRRNTGDKPVLMLDAHSDEVGFMVHSIRPTGTLRVVQLGGWNRATLPGAAVLVRNREGKWIPGVIAAAVGFALTFFGIALFDRFLGKKTPRITIVRRVTDPESLGYLSAESVDRE